MSRHVEQQQNGNMSCYTIYYNEGVKMMRPVTSRDEYLLLRNSERQKMIVASVRKGDDKMKNRLLQMNYSCMPNEDGTLKGSTRMTTTVGMDVDLHRDDYDNDGDYQMALADIPEKVLAKKEELGLLMLERSATKGYHLVFKRHAELTQEENLRWASELLGVEYDRGAKDITRVFFTTTASKEDLIYLDDEIFENDAMAQNPEVAQGVNPVEKDRQDSMKQHETMSPLQGLTYHDIPYSTIISKYWEVFNEGKVPAEGDRNVKTYELAMTLRPICDYSQEMMEKVIPRYDGFPEDEWRKTIANALGEPRKSMPYRLRQVLAAVKNDRRMALMAGNNTLRNGGDGGGMPERPRRMPEVLKLLSSKVPTKYKAMVEEAVWPAICAHLKGVTFRYIDGVSHEPNISSPLIGRQSSGKGAVNMPIEFLLADITAKDKENENRLLDWRRRNQGKGASKDRQPRPDDIVIQRLDDDLTPAALSQALIDAETNGGKRVITKVDEIELLNRIGNGKNDTIGVLVRYGWDAARWGQRRVGLESVSGSYTVRWVWNASCTLKSAHKFITSTWIADGSLSRLNVNGLLLPKDDHELPKIGEYDDKFANDLRIFVDRLNAASGLIECPQANRLAMEMKTEHDKIADLSESEGYRTFSYRAVVIGWLKAMMLFIMNGYKWEKPIADYVRYSVRRDMFLKMYFFGQQIEAEFEEEEQRQHGPHNLLSELPDEFTYEEFLELRKCQGRKGDGKSTLRTWKTRGYIEYDDVTERYLKKMKN